MVLFPSIMTSTFGLLPDVTSRALTAMETGHTVDLHPSIIGNCFVWEWTFYSGPYQMIVSCYRSQGVKSTFKLALYVKWSSVDKSFDIQVWCASLLAMFLYFIKGFFFSSWPKRRERDKNFKIMLEQNYVYIDTYWRYLKIFELIWKQEIPPKREQWKN